MVFDNHCSLCFAKQIPSEIGLHQDDFSNEKSVLTDTKLQATLRLLSASTDGLRLPLFQSYTLGKESDSCSPCISLGFKKSKQGSHLLHSSLLVREMPHTLLLAIPPVLKW